MRESGRAAAPRRDAPAQTTQRKRRGLHLRDLLRMPRGRRPARVERDDLLSGSSRPTVNERYRQICYNLVGERLDAKERPDVADRLKSANLNFTPGMYYGVLIVTTAVAMATGAVLGILLFVLLAGAENGWLLAGVLGFVAAAVTAAVFPFVITNRISNRSNQLEKELPFTLSEMAVMASIGLSPINLVRKMAARKHDPALTGEFNKVVFMVDLQGKDLVTALTETAKESPSKALRDAFWDLANMIHQGGSLDAYLRGRSDEVMEQKRAGQEAFIDRLSVFSDIYITVVLMGVMFISIGAFLMDAFQMTAGPFSAGDLLQLLAYGFVPVVTTVLAIMLATAHGKAS